jgi:hypothetical protein
MESVLSAKVGPRARMVKEAVFLDNDAFEKGG